VGEKYVLRYSRLKDNVIFKNPTKPDPKMPEIHYFSKSLCLNDVYVSKKG
jgi:hypothetical protein